MRKVFRPRVKSLCAASVITSPESSPYYYHLVSDTASGLSENCKALQAGLRKPMNSTGSVLVGLPEISGR